MFVNILSTLGSIFPEKIKIMYTKYCAASGTNHIQKYQQLFTLG